MNAIRAGGFGLRPARRGGAALAPRNIRVRGAALAGLLTLSCSAPSDRTDTLPGSDARVDRVLTGLYVREAEDSQPSETWSLRERMQHHRVPAVSIAILRDGAIEWARAYALEEESDERISVETLFQAASISKALTAFAVLRLVDEGVLDLDEPVNRYLRSWRLPDSDAGAADSVTVRLLLAHMAGLNVPGFPGYRADTPLPALSEILDGVQPANTPPIRITAPPGSRWSYSGGGYVVLQQVIEDATGADFAGIMSEKVLSPLGMSRSTFRQPLPAELAAVAASGHDERGARIEGRWHVYPELAPAGLWTTPSDLARFALAVRAEATRQPEALLSDEMGRALVTPQFGAFSLGLLVRRNGEDSWFTHNGGNAGYRALMYAYLTTGDGAVVMTNSDGGMGLADEIINSIAREYGWPMFRPEGLQ